MSSVLLLVIGLTAFLTGYQTYSRYIARRIFRLRPTAPTPAHEFNDGIDYVPTNRHVLFGHHFTSVAGAAPIVGPAIAVIWGWLPAFLWVAIGTVVAGAVHDFGALWISVRHKGQSIGSLAEGIVGSRARVLFMLIIFFLLLLVNSVFAVIISNQFIAYPATVIPVWGELVFAVSVGYLIYRRGTGVFWPSLAALVGVYALIWFGQDFPVSLPDLVGFSPTPAQIAAAGGDLAAAQEAARLDGVRALWIVILLIYAFLASALPVWLLLQPRDYINSHQLFAAFAVIFAGLLIVRPEVLAPAINDALPAGTPAWFPLLFVTIACGAISGFHGLVASGTTSKQLACEPDARFVGYGGAIGEGTLALTSIIATTAAFGIAVGSEGWHAHYASWASAESGATTAFVEGVAVLASGLGVPQGVSVTFASMVLISFAATTMDTATRLQRYIVSELGARYRIGFLQNRWIATSVAVATVAILALGIDRGAGGMRLWPLFGTTNQLMAGLTLLVISLFLISLKRSFWVTAVPMTFLLFVTTWGMVLNLARYFGERHYLLLGVGAAIFTLEIWLILEAALGLRRALERRRQIERRQAAFRASVAESSGTVGVARGSSGDEKRAVEAGGTGVHERD